MSKGLTARQREVLEAIREFAARKGYPPSIRELGRALGISSLRGVTIHLDALARKGFIERESTSRSIRVLSQSGDYASGQVSRSIVTVPLLGSIAAGVPLLAVENVESYVPIPAEMATNATEVFALRVRGDSMIGDAILDGDTIVVRGQPSAENGEIVAALIGDEATVKRLDKSSRPARLLASNPSYEPIELARDDVRILGKVMGLMRTYGA
jgi:repressor LexA